MVSIMESRIAPESAAAALADIERTRAVATRRRRTPRWVWHAFAGTQLVMLIPLVLVPPSVVNWLILVLVPAGFAVTALFDRLTPDRLFGTSSRSRRIEKLHILATVAVLVAGMIAMIRLDATWPFVVATVGCYLLTIWLGPLSERGTEDPERPVSR